MDEEQRNRDQLNALDDLPLDWMLKRIKYYFPDFPVSEAGWAKVSEETLQKKARATQHQPRTGVYLVWPRAFRSLNNEVVSCRKIPMLRTLSEINVGRDRHQAPTDEMLHISALYRSNLEIQVDGSNATYSPKNLRTALARIAARNERRQLIPIVDWDGTPLDPQDAKAFEKIAATAREDSPAPMHDAPGLV